MMKSSKSKDYDSMANVYNSIDRLLSKTKINYLNYFTHNKSYIEAKKIYNSNRQLLLLLETHLNHTDTEIKSEFIKIINHLKNWFSSYEIALKKKDPKGNDSFIFSNGHSFPKEAEIKIRMFIKSYTTNL